MKNEAEIWYAAAIYDAYLVYGNEFESLAKLIETMKNEHTNFLAMQHEAEIWHVVVICDVDFAHGAEI